MEISKDLLGEVLSISNISSIIYDINFPNIIEYNQYATLARGMRSTEINLYELVHLNFKHWAKLMDVFDKIDWSEEPEEIIKKVEELRKEINQ